MRRKAGVWLNALSSGLIGRHLALFWIMAHSESPFFFVLEQGCVTLTMTSAVCRVTVDELHIWSQLPKEYREDCSSFSHQYIIRRACATVHVPAILEPSGMSQRWEETGRRNIDAVVQG
jgi:hypothetical protein